MSSYRVINGLIDLGAQVIHKGTANLQLSGHVAPGELVFAYTSSNPARHCESWVSLAFAANPQLRSARRGNQPHL
jgi:Predicted hydrolase of the metallo-beta-lactamase superfamily